MICGKDIIDLDLFLKLICSMIRAGVLDTVMSHHPNRHELTRGPMRTAIEQLDFLVMAKFEVTNYLVFHKFEPTLLNYLAGTRWAEATNPLDKVYGILSLADDACSLGSWDTSRGKEQRWLPFKVDYNLSKEEVFINVTKAILDTTGSLGILRFARYEPNSAHRLPSWVPDWASQTTHRVFGHRSVCPAGKDKKIAWRLHPDPRDVWDDMFEQITQHCSPKFELGKANALKVKGFHLDTITALSTNAYPPEDRHALNPQSKDPTEGLEPMRQYLKIIAQWTDDCVHLARGCSPYPTGQSTWSAFWKTLTKGTSSEDKPILQGFEALLSDLGKAQSALEAVKTQLSSTQSRSPDALSEVAAGAALSHFQSLISWLPSWNSRCHSRRFVTTRKKYMGLVPDGAMVGDLLCTVHGCEQPLVLRKCGRKGFRLVGLGEFEGFAFDDVVVEERVERKGKEKLPTEGFDFVAWKKMRPGVSVRLKKVRYFKLV
jgi:hypothetical protein